MNNSIEFTVATVMTDTEADCVVVRRSCALTNQVCVCVIRKTRRLCGTSGSKQTSLDVDVGCGLAIRSGNTEVRDDVHAHVIPNLSVQRNYRLSLDWGMRD